MKTDLCAVLAQIVIVILGGICIAIGTESVWVGGGVALVGIGVASGPLFWTCFSKLVVVHEPL